MAGCASSAPAQPTSTPPASGVEAAAPSTSATSPSTASPPPSKEKESPTVGQVGQRAHTFFLRTANPDLSGVEIFDLNKIVGRRAERPQKLVLSFAAWYCEPCKRELAAYAAQRRRLASSEASVGIVVMDDDAAERKKMIRYLIDELKLPFPIVEDSFQLVSRKYGVRSLPHTALVDGEGIIRRISTGFEGRRSLRELFQALREL